MNSAARAVRILASLALLSFTAFGQTTFAPDVAPELPDFTFTERDGSRVTKQDLLGEPWIATLFFTSCAGPCPRLSVDIRGLVHDQLQGSGVRIVSFTVDPEYDSLERLSTYAETYTTDPERWLFVRGEEPVIHGFIQDGLKLAVAPGQAESEAERLVARLQATHSTRLTVIDAEGRIRGYFECGGEEGLERAEVEANFAKLVAFARALDGPVSTLPRVNAMLNGLAGVLLLIGLYAIKLGKKDLHGVIMRCAFLASAAFLACYLYYHFVVLPASGGPTKYYGAGWRRPAYLALLLSHVVLAVINLPMVLRTFWLAHKEDWERHRRLAVKTFPIWLYVSVTGVLVYLVLYHWNPLPA